MHRHHHHTVNYGVLEDMLNDMEDLMFDLIMAERAIVDLCCPHCNRKTVHHMFRENPDGGFDEVALKCRKCNKML